MYWRWIIQAGWNGRATLENLREQVMIRGVWQVSWNVPTVIVSKLVPSLGIHVLCNWYIHQAKFDVTWNSCYELTVKQSLRAYW